MFYSAILTDFGPFATRQLEDLIDRVTQDRCSTREMMLAVPPETLHAYRQMVSVGETEFVDRVKVFKWRDMLQFMAIKILADDGGVDWKMWDISAGRYMLSSILFSSPQYSGAPFRESRLPSRFDAQICAGEEFPEFFDRESKAMPKPTRNFDFTPGSEFEYKVGEAIVRSLYYDEGGCATRVSRP